MESLYPFPENIIIETRSPALEHARAISNPGPIDRSLVMWVDASVAQFPRTERANRHAASAVRYLDLSTSRWTESVTLNTLHYGAPFAHEAEFIAIHEAFRIAYTLTERFDRLVVLSDCQQILHGLRRESMFDCLHTPCLKSALFFYANVFYDAGIAVELKWVPSHSMVEGNERVDELARRIRQDVQFIMSRKAPDRIIKDLVLNSSSRGSLREALLEKDMSAFEGQEEGSHDGRVMEDGTGNPQTEPSEQISTLEHSLTTNLFKEYQTNKVSERRRRYRVKKSKKRRRKSSEELYQKFCLRLVRKNFDDLSVRAQA